MRRTSTYLLVVLLSVFVNATAWSQITGAIVSDENSNILKVTLSEAVNISGAEGWYLVGGAAEIVGINPQSSATELMFDLSDHVLPDDSFSLYYYAEIGNTKTASGHMAGVSAFDVANEVSTYSGTGTVYHVAPDGVAGNPGTDPAAPTTFSAAAGRLNPGDFILFKRGEIYGTQIFLRDIEGTADRNIVIGYYGEGEAPEIVPPGGVPLSLINCAYVQAVGFTVKPVLGANGVRIDRGTRFSKVRSVKVFGKENAASLADPDRTYGTTQGIVYSRFGGDQSVRSVQCEVLHCYVDTFHSGIYGESPNQCFVGFNRIRNIGEDGIRIIQGDASFTRIAFNEITEWSDDAIDMFTGSNVITEYNNIHDPMLPLSNGANNGIKGGGVFNPNLGQPTSYNNIYRYNKIYNLPMRLGFTPAGITTNGCLSGEIYGNLCYNIDHNAIEITRSDRLSDNWRVYNNTAVSNEYNGLFVAPDNQQVETFNNIFLGPLTDVRVNGNSVVQGQKNVLLTGNTTGGYSGEHDFILQPADVFTDFESNDFRITTGSPIIDEGLEFAGYEKDIEGRYIDWRPEPGCYEFPPVPCVEPIPAITVSREDNTFTGADETTLFLGYGAQSLSLHVSDNANNDKVTFAWSSFDLLTDPNSASTAFHPVEAGTYTFTVAATTRPECSATAQITIEVVDVRCGGAGEKIALCKNGDMICVARAAVPALLQSGATLYPCLQREAGLTLHPNPATGDKVWVTLGSEAAGASSVVILDSSQFPVRSFNSSDVTGFEIVTAGLRSGIYMVVVTTSSDVRVARLIVP